MSVSPHVAASAAEAGARTRAHKSLAYKSRVAFSYVLRASRDLFRYCRLRPHFPRGGLKYDDYWQVRDPVKIGTRFQLLASMVAENTAVLDVGCGDGTLLEYMAACKQVKATGIDISEEAVLAARDKGLDVRVGDITKGALPARQFDHVVCGEVLEHIAEPERVLVAAGQLARETVVVSVPNVGYYFDRLRLLFGRFPVQWLHHPAEHLRFFTVADFVDWARDLGFEVESMAPAAGFPVLMKWWPNLFSQQTVFSLRAVEREPETRSV